MSDKTQTTLLSDREKFLLSAIWMAWKELNAIRAREGMPHHIDDGMPYCTEEWFSEVVDACASSIYILTGRPPEPWVPEETK